LSAWPRKKLFVVISTQSLPCVADYVNDVNPRLDGERLEGRHKSGAVFSESIPDDAGKKGDWRF
jgi:hypothetical protein